MTLPRFLSLFGRLSRPFLVPAKTASVGARSCGRGRLLGRRAMRAFLDGGEHAGKLSTTGTTAMTSRAARAAVLVGLIALSLATADRALAQQLSPSRRDPADSAVIERAAARFGLPVHWIEAVIAVESGGDQLAVSRKGAMGLMQLMPGTWAQMRRDHRLGDDPFDRQDNVLAGVAYLRGLYDQFGATGAFAAYNAGPARYAAHLTRGRPLPAETWAYVTAIRRRLGWRDDLEAVAPQADWQTAPLFAETGVGAIERGR